MTNNGTSKLFQESNSDANHGNSVVGISLAIGANFLVSVSLNVQKYAHNKNTQVLTRSARQPIPLTPACRIFRTPSFRCGGWACS
jgi:hypothetical protein